MGAERFLHGHTTSVIDIAASPDGKRLASLDNHGMMVLWDVEAGEKIAAYQVDEREGTAVAWSPHGNQLAAGTNHPA